ncbi:LysR substrate-binding domain-containing protein [soil metagenome]
MDNLNLNDVLGFVRVCEAGSFTAAAAALGVPKSTLSARVKRLEAALGARLLQRTTRHVRPTAAGAAYARIATAALHDLAEGSRRLAEEGDTLRGHLRISAPVVMGNAFVGPVLSRFLAQHPLLTAYLQLTDRAVDPVEEGMDVAFRVRLAPSRDSSFIVKKLGSTDLVVVARTDVANRVRSLDALATAPCLTYGDTTSEDWALRDASGTSHTVKVKSRLSSTDFRALLEAALQGLGVARIPAPVCVAALEAGALRRVLRAYRSPSADLSACYPSRRHVPQAVRQLLDFAATQTTEVDWITKPPR